MTVRPAVKVDSVQRDADFHFGASLSFVDDFSSRLRNMKKNKLRQICQLFSSIDFFWKKECTGGTRLMRKESFR